VTDRPGACLRCGSRRRWRPLHTRTGIGCWRCFPCTPPEAALQVVDIAGWVHSEPRLSLGLITPLTTREFVISLADYGIPVAMEWKPLPCRCRQCGSRP
jgi:hypothetical protein